MSQLSSSCQPPPIAIQINTTKQEYHNHGQTLDENSDLEAVSIFVVTMIDLLTLCPGASGPL